MHFLTKMLLFVFLSQLFNEKFCLPVNYENKSTRIQPVFRFADDFKKTAASKKNSAVKMDDINKMLFEYEKTLDPNHAFQRDNTEYRSKRSLGFETSYETLDDKKPMTKDFTTMESLNNNNQEFWRPAFIIPTDGEKTINNNKPIWSETKILPTMESFNRNNQKFWRPAFMTPTDDEKTMNDNKRSETNFFPTMKPLNRDNQRFWRPVFMAPTDGEKTINNDKPMWSETKVLPKLEALNSDLWNPSYMTSDYNENTVTYIKPKLSETSFETLGINQETDAYFPYNKYKNNKFIYGDVFGKNMQPTLEVNKLPIEPNSKSKKVIDDEYTPSGYFNHPSGQHTQMREKRSTKFVTKSKINKRQKVI
ncbi:uncharacterized protein LOC124809001 [Hydra vulgaris]|uniref:uncharacterized protein LOC124809001 n=1 Tax=Hydra vulgaris TaxID=6087 RepID=UPI0032EA8287